MGSTTSPHPSLPTSRLATAALPPVVSSSTFPPRSEQPSSGVGLGHPYTSGTNVLPFLVTLLRPEIPQPRTALESLSYVAYVSYITRYHEGFRRPGPNPWPTSLKHSGFARNAQHPCFAIVQLQLSLKLEAGLRQPTASPSQVGRDMKDHRMGLTVGWLITPHPPPGGFERPMNITRDYAHMS